MYCLSNLLELIHVPKVCWEQAPMSSCQGSLNVCEGKIYMHMSDQYDRRRGDPGRKSAISSLYKDPGKPSNSMTALVFQPCYPRTCKSRPPFSSSLGALSFGQRCALLDQGYHFHAIRPATSSFMHIIIPRHAHPTVLSGRASPRIACLSPVPPTLKLTVDGARREEQSN